MSSLGKFQPGDFKVLAKYISRYENYPEDRGKILAQIYPYVSHSWIIGVTGPPGVGKSSLISALIKKFRGLEHKVGIIVIDPSSPVSGGAFLGDRIRMREHFSDNDVFIRSLATRHSATGISEATTGIITLMDAAGLNPIIIESIGVGQNEAELLSLADSGILVQMPGLGDEMQAMKAGVLELADIIVLNKKDLDPGDAFASSLSAWLPQERKGWKPQLIKTQAVLEEGIDELHAALERHKHFLACLPEQKDATLHKNNRQLDRLFQSQVAQTLSRFRQSTTYRELCTRAASQDNPYLQLGTIYRAWLEWSTRD